MLKNFPKSEMIGLKIEVVEAENPCLTGISGEVVDETKNTITVQTKTNQKKLIKDQIKFKTKYKGKKIKVHGEKLSKRPEERIKTR